MDRRDSRSRYTTAMEEYLEEYGFHFNKRLFEFAVGMMKDRNGQKLAPWDKDKCTEFLKNHGVTLRNNLGHDSAYVLNMARSDYYGSSIVDETHLAVYVRDYLDDIDGAPTRAFDEFYMKCIALGVPIFWDEMM